MSDDQSIRTRITPELNVHLIKAETGESFMVPPNAVVSNVMELEDEFQKFYGSPDLHILVPPLPLKTLEYLGQHNNALGPCVDAMEANIDGTGFILECCGDTESLEDLDIEQKQVHERLMEFFDEPFPGQSFTTIRRQLRRDMEITGNGYLEVMRSPQDEIVFIRNVPSSTIRMVRLERPVPVQKAVSRGGKELTYTVMARERKFVQVIANRLTYFKERGASRDLHKVTGDWTEQGQRLASEERATELIHFTLMKDTHTPYGVPRWASQLPSVLGSRKAEEHNLEYFNSGGIPPLLMLVQGGQMAPHAVDALQEMFGGKTQHSHRAAVMEAHSTSGSIDSANNVRVTVERFGSERQNDSMFENYDTRCEERIRGAFRLPPLFVGKAGDYSYATAFASYTVAEAQVFQPERQEFDEIVNMAILPELGGKGFKFRSLPVMVKDAALQLQALEQAVSVKAVDRAQIITSLNEITNLSLKVEEEVSQEIAGDSDNAAPPGGPPAFGNSGKGPVPTDPPSPPSAEGVAKSMTSTGLVALVKEVSVLMKAGVRSVDQCNRLHELMQLVSILPSLDKQIFQQMLSAQTIIGTSEDPDGLADIAGCSLEIMAGGLNGDKETQN